MYIMPGVVLPATTSSSICESARALKSPFAAGAAVNLTGTFTQDALKEALSAEKLAVTAMGGITGTPTVRVNGAPNPYRPLILVPSSDGKSLSLQYANGTIVIFR